MGFFAFCFCLAGVSTAAPLCYLQCLAPGNRGEFHGACLLVHFPVSLKSFNHADFVAFAFL